MNSVAFSYITINIVYHKIRSLGTTVLICISFISQFGISLQVLPFTLLEMAEIDVCDDKNSKAREKKQTEKTKTAHFFFSLAQSLKRG